MKETYGVPVEEIQQGIKHGVRKINVDTDNRLAITGAIRKVFAETPEKFDPRDYLKPAREAMAEVVKARMIAFGQAGWADKVPSTSASRRWRSVTRFVTAGGARRCTGNSARCCASSWTRSARRGCTRKSASWKGRRAPRSRWAARPC